MSEESKWLFINVFGQIKTSASKRADVSKEGLDKAGKDIKCEKYEIREWLKNENLNDKWQFQFDINRKYDASGAFLNYDHISKEYKNRMYSNRRNHVRKNKFFTKKEYIDCLSIIIENQFIWLI